MTLTSSHIPTSNIIIKHIRILKSNFFKIYNRFINYKDNVSDLLNKQFWYEISSDFLIPITCCFYKIKRRFLISSFGIYKQLCTQFTFLISKTFALSNFGNE